MLDFLRHEGVREEIIRQIEAFRAEYPLEDGTHYRVPAPSYLYYGTEIWEKALTALLSGENLLHALVPVAYCGIMSTGVGYLCQTLGQKGVRPAFAALIMSLESVFCVIAGALLLGERNGASPSPT